MTEQQAIKRLKSEMEWESIELNREAFSMGIKALEEIQQYRAIGTVEEIQQLIKKEVSERRKLEEYFMLGSVEELQALKEKSVAKKPFQPFGTHSYKCPTCWKFVAHEVDDNCDLKAEMAEWCPFCSQHLDWE